MERFSSLIKILHPRIIFWVVLLSVTLLSLIPKPPQFVNPFLGMDKLEHALAYAVLGFLRYLSRVERDRPFPFLRAVLFLGVYGGIIEVAQIFTGRTPELLDLAADIAGAALGSGIGLLIVKLGLGSNRPVN